MNGTRPAHPCVIRASTAFSAVVLWSAMSGADFFSRGSGSPGRFAAIGGHCGSRAGAVMAAIAALFGSAFQGWLNRVSAEWAEIPVRRDMPGSIVFRAKCGCPAFMTGRRSAFDLFPGAGRPAGSPKFRRRTIRFRPFQPSAVAIRWPDMFRRAPFAVGTRFETAFPVGTPFRAHALFDSLFLAAPVEALFPVEFGIALTRGRSVLAFVRGGIFLGECVERGQP